MTKIRKKSAVLCMLLCCLMGTGCDMLRDLSLGVPAEQEVQTESMTTAEPETTIPETTIPETTEAETTLPPTEAVTEPPAPLELQYPNEKVMEIYNHFALSEGSVLSDTITSVDWQQVPMLHNTAEMRQYLHEEMSACRKHLPLILLRGCKMADADFLLNDVGVIVGNQSYFKVNRDGTRLTFLVYDLEYSTGRLAVHAMETGDTSGMDARDLAAYEKALNFVNHELDRTASPVEQERQIHDYICAQTTYLDMDNQPGRESFRMATGVLLDGEANCMGYSDAFYMIATMAGFDVGTDTNETHMWNTILLDGRRYLVDVTWDDDSVILPDGSLTWSYDYFNADIASATEHYGEE